MSGLNRPLPAEQVAPEEGDAPSAETPFEASPTKAPFLKYVHSMRGLASCIVVAYHVLVAEDWRECTVWAHLPHLLLSNSTNLFVFISGFLVQHLSSGFRYGRFLSTRLSTVFLPYVVVSTPLILRQYWRHAGMFAVKKDVSPFVIALRAYLTGSHMPVPFWFMPVIMVFYVSTPIFFAVARLGGLSYLLAGVVAVGMFVHRPDGHSFGVQGLLYFLPAYLAGMMVGLRRESVFTWIGRHRLWLLTVMLGLVVTNAVTQDRWGPLYSHSAFSRESGLLDLDLPAKLIATVLLLALLRRYDGLTWRWLRPAADLSFGVFLLHEPVLQLVDTGHWMSRIHAWPIRVVAIPLVATVVILICMALLRVTKRYLGKRSRFILGY